MLYTFEDKEAVIKMIIAGRSPTMRHVSRTHRFALNWLFDRINFDPQIQIKNMDTKHQLADILTKGSFTRDEWNNLLRVFNISNHSSKSELQNMAKRVQDGTREERAMAKSRLTSEDLGLSSSTGKPVARNSNQNNEVSSSQEKQKDDKTASAGRTTEWEANQDSDLPTSTWKLVAGDLKIVDMGYDWQDDCQISETSDLYREKENSSLRQKLVEKRWTTLARIP